MGEFLVSLTESDMINSLKLEIGLSQNPFSEGEFVIRNNETDETFYDIKCPMGDKFIEFNIGEKDVKYINEKKEKYNPEFRISFDDSDTLRIPKTLKIMTISLEAEVDHTISIGGGE
jgi:hypothetical protein